MSVIIQGYQLREIAFGQQVTSTVTGLTSGATSAWTVSGGKVIVTSLVGVVTTVVQSQTTAVKFQAVPTTGTTVDMCATLDLNAAEVGALLSVDGVLATALQGGVSKSGAVGLMTKAQVVAPGAIKINSGATSTGAITWTLTYIPYDTGASIASV